MRPTAVSFDFWNTLFTETPGGFSLYKDNRRRSLRQALSGVAEFDDAQLDHACRLEAESHHLTWLNEHYTVGTAQRVDQILKHLGITAPPGVATGIVTLFEEAILDHPPILVSGAADIVKELARSYRLGIISDVGFSPGRVLRTLLARENILDLFDSLIFSDEAGRSKPHHQVFLRTADNLNAEPGEIVHIGDLEHTDVVGAKRAGYRAIRFVGVTPMEDGETTIADRVTADLRELPSLIRGL